MEKILWKENTLPKTDKEESVKFLNKEEVSKAKKFHESFLEYDKTPLIDLKELAEKIGLGGIYLKDESYRFGLNAFKVLGGSFAMGRYLAEKLGEDIDDLPYEKMTCKEVKDKLGNITFVTATDGNHGRELHGQPIG